MATLGELITDISLKLLDEGNTSVSTTSVVSAINASVRKWKNTAFWFNQGNATVVLTIANPIVTLPSDFLAQIKDAPLVINFSQSRYILTKVSNGQYDNQNVEGNGLPYIYTYKTGQILLYFYPDQAYNLEFKYLKEYGAFATDGSDNANTNDFLTNAEDLISYDALARLHGELKQDEKMETYYSARAEDEKKTLKNRTNRLQSTGNLSTEQI